MSTRDTAQSGRGITVPSTLGQPPSWDSLTSAQVTTAVRRHAAEIDPCVTVAASPPPHGTTVAIRFVISANGAVSVSQPESETPDSFALCVARTVQTLALPCTRSGNRRRGRDVQLVTLANVRTPPPVRVYRYGTVSTGRARVAPSKSGHRDDAADRPAPRDVSKVGALALTIPTRAPTVRS